MKQTRKLFVLIGNQSYIDTVTEQIDFKGLTILDKKNIIDKDITDVFINNKSVVCTTLPPPDFIDNAIFIYVTNPCDQAPFDSDIIILDDNIPKQFEAIANKYNCDIGDHKLKTSGLNGAPSVDDCYYCKYLKKLFNNGINERTIYRSPNFFVMPTIGQLIPGYLLIIPNEHVMSTAELSPALQKEFYNVLNDVLYILKLTYNRYHFLVWENGTGNAGKGKAIDSVVHAHTHIAPSYLTVQSIEHTSGFPFEHLSIDNISKYSNNSYLLIRDEYKGLWKICSDPKVYIPRQYIRQLIAQENNLDGELWNWRTHPFNEQMMQTCADISKALRENWDNLPERIKLYTRHYILDF